MAVFPERMDRHSGTDLKKQVETVQDYIEYMTERIEFHYLERERAMSATVEELKDKITALEKGEGK